MNNILTENDEKFIEFCTRDKNAGERAAHRLDSLICELQGPMVAKCIVHSLRDAMRAWKAGERVNKYVGSNYDIVYEIHRRHEKFLKSSVKNNGEIIEREVSRLEKLIQFYESVIAVARSAYSDSERGDTNTWGKFYRVVFPCTLSEHTGENPHGKPGNEYLYNTIIQCRHLHLFYF